MEEEQRKREGRLNDQDEDPVVEKGGGVSHLLTRI